MSTDFEVACDKCKKVRHLGQRMATTYSFGFGSNDKEGADQTLRWIEHHLIHCGPPRIISIVEPTAADYDYVHDEKIQE